MRKIILLYSVPSHVCIRGNEKWDAVAQAGLLRRVTHNPIPYGDLKKHINVLLKRKWQSKWYEAINDLLHGILSQLGLFFRIIRREEKSFSKNKNWPYSLDSLLPFEKRPSKVYRLLLSLTVKHLYFNVLIFIESRNRHFHVTSFKDIFVKGSPDTIFILFIWDWFSSSIVEHLRDLASFTTNMNVQLILPDCSLFCEHLYSFITLLLLFEYNSWSFLNRFHGTKWPLCADVPLSNRLPINTFIPKVVPWELHSRYQWILNEWMIV